MDMGTRRRAVWMSVVICILSSIASVHLQASSREYFVAVGQKVTLTCDRNTPGWTQHDNPNIRSITWRRGEGSGATEIDLTNSREARITFTKDVNQHSASIRIANVQHSDAGFYSCLVEREFGTESLKMEIITMEVSAYPSRSVTEGATVTLKCDISNSAYVQSIVWTHGRIEMNKGNSVLTLHKVKRCQEGAWTCGVKPQTDQASASLDLKVSSQNVCEVKEPAPRKYFVSVGQTAILPCVESDPEFKWKDHPSSDRAVIWKWERQGSGSPTIVQYPKQTGQWTRDVSKNTAIPLVYRITALESAFDQDNFSIQISNVQYSDAGLYICHFAGYFRTSSLTRELITMQVSANPPSSVKEGENVTLTCLISNSAYGTGLVWYHGDTYIHQGNRLTLNKVKRIQQGEWKCVLQSQHSRPLASYKLEFTSTGSEVRKAPAVKKYFIHEGGEVTLSCDESDPGFKWRDRSQLARAVTWKWRSHGTTQGYDQKIQNPLQSSDSKDQFPLTLSTVTFSRGGVYTCEFTGYYRTGTLTMELITIKVSANPSRSVTEGETVTLTCLILNRGFRSGPFWYHSDTYIDRGKSLTLKKVKRSQQGEWKCFLHDHHHIPFSSYKLEFTSTGSDVGQAPAVKKYFIHEGGEVSLSCDESDPGFKWRDHSQLARAVTWKWRLHDGTTNGSDQTLQNPPQSSDYEDQFPLKLSQVTLSHGGLYTCEFTGYYRTGTLTMELVTMKVSSNTSDTVAEGESISLTCQLSNDSYAHMVRWIHNGIEISHQSSIVLVKVNAAHSGLLKCAVKRESGEISEVAYNVNVLKNDSEHQTIRNYAAQIGEGITLPCNESDPGFVWRSSSTESRSVTCRSGGPWERRPSLASPGDLGCFFRTQL
ncbi:unnamed protein product [Lampetra fluviatilis]